MPKFVLRKVRRSYGITSLRREFQKGEHTTGDAAPDWKRTGGVLPLRQFAERRTDSRRRHRRRHHGRGHARSHRCRGLPDDSQDPTDEAQDEADEESAKADDTE